MGGAEGGENPPLSPPFCNPARATQEKKDKAAFMGAKMFLQQPDKAEGSQESRHAFYQLSTVEIAAGDRRRRQRVLVETCTVHMA